MSETSGDAQATGITEAQAAEMFAARLAPKGDSEAGEPLKGEQPEAEEEDEAPAESEPEEQSDGQDEPDEQPSEPKTYRVKVDGAEVEVTEDELLKGYSREQDYTRKTMALGEKAKALEAQEQAFAAERARATELLKALETHLQAPTLTPEQMAWLRDNNRTEYAIRLAEEHQRQTEQAAVRAERERLEHQQAEENTRAAQRGLQLEQARLLEALPTWKDPKVAATDKALVADYGLKRGLTLVELNSIADHRFVPILLDAAKYRALQEKVPQTKAKVEGVKPAKPGVASQQPGKASEAKRAEQRLARSGRVEDAAAILLQRMG